MITRCQFSKHLAMDADGPRSISTFRGLTSSGLWAIFSMREWGSYGEEALFLRLAASRFITNCFIRYSLGANLSV